MNETVASSTPTPTPTPALPTSYRSPRSLRRPRSLLTAAAASALLPSASALSLNLNPNASPLLTSSCSESQASLHLTINTDAHSINDNSWRITRSSSLEVVETGSVETDDAVVESTVCVDASEEGECWDFELHDEFGDGLTAPHSDSGGAPGGFALHYNSNLVASHTGTSCLLSDEDGKFNTCAGEFGFEYCGLRICRLPGGESISVSNLKGSQCILNERTCDDAKSDGRSEMFRVEVDTDGYAEDLSWDLRDSNGNLVMSGGNAGPSTLAQVGGAEFDNFESFQSTVCLSSRQDQCYDFRAYDAYGDGISCGADGAISLSFPGMTTLLQMDENVARLQRLEDGTKKMACMEDDRGLQTWSLCHVRICADGSITGLEGNQCSFGNPNLIDANASGEFPNGMELNLQAQSEAQMFSMEDDPQALSQASNSQGTNSQSTTSNDPCVDRDCTFLNGMELNLQAQLEAQMFSMEDDPQALLQATNSQGTNSQSTNSNDPCVDKDCTLAQEFSITKPELMTASFEDKGEDLSWAEYFHPLLGASTSGSSNNNDQAFGAIKPQSSETFAGNEYKLSLEPFYIHLLSPSSPYKLRYYRPHHMSLAISTYLLSYLDENIEGWNDNNAPLHFELDCNKSTEQFGGTSKRVVKCEGSAVFPKPSLPDDGVMNDLVHQAFAGIYHEEFLEFMYEDYTPGSDVSGEEELTKKEKKEQRLEAKMQALLEEMSNEKKDDGEFDKKEKKEQKLQAILDGLTKKEKKEMRKKNRNEGGRRLRYG